MASGYTYDLWVESAQGKGGYTYALWVEADQGTVVPDMKGYAFNLWVESPSPGTAGGFVLLPAGTARAFQAHAPRKVLVNGAWR